MNQPIQPIKEVEHPTVEHFQRELYFSAEPIVMRGIAKDWEAVAAARQSPQTFGKWLKSAVGSKEVNILTGKDPDDSTFFYDDNLIDINFERSSMPFDRFVDTIVESYDDASAANLYLQGTEARNLSAQLREALQLPYAPASSEPSVWMGNETTAQTHFDLSQNIAVVISGNRRFTLFPPEQIANLYMGPVEYAPCGTPISMVRLDNPDFAKHPRFSEALSHAQQAELEPGDAVFIPYMWWHQVQAKGQMTMLANYWWNEYDDFGSPMYSMLHTILTIRDMPPAMRSAWKAMFDHFVFGDGAKSMDHMPMQMRGGLGPVSPPMRQNLWRGIAAGIAPHLNPRRNQK